MRNRRRNLLTEIKDCHRFFAMMENRNNFGVIEFLKKLRKRNGQKVSDFYKIYCLETFFIFKIFLDKTETSAIQVFRVP